MSEQALEQSEERRRETKELYSDQVRRWRTLWAATFAMLCVVLVFFLIIRADLASAARQRDGEIAQLTHVLDRIGDNQEGIDVLVDFVKDLQEAEPEDGPDLQVFVDLLCASEDPVRIEACERIRAEGIAP